MNPGAKLTAIVGVPCVGKSTVMRKLMAASGVWTFVPQKNLAHHRHEDSGAIILGRYDEEHQFPGTDRLSMGVQPHAVQALYQHAGAILFEGARLGTPSFIRSARESGRDVTVCVLTMSPTALHARREAERVQPEKFLRTQATKVANLVEEHHDIAFPFDVTLPEDADRFVRWLRAARMR